MDLTASGAYTNGPCLLRIGGETRRFRGNVSISKSRYWDVWLLLRNQQANLKRCPAGPQVKMAQVQ